MLYILSRNVLFYICGYMARKLKSPAGRGQLKHSDQVISCLTTEQQQDCQRVNCRYARWIEKQNRGGLVFPKQEFFLLVQQLDAIYRKSVKSAGSLLT